MKRIGVRASEGLELTGRGGLVFVGAMLERFTDFRDSFNRAFMKGPGGIPFGDVLTGYLASLCTGSSDFAGVSHLYGSLWAARALQVDRVASPETTRQDMDRLADQCLPQCKERIDAAALDLIVRQGLRPSPLRTGHVPVDGDTTPQDNSKTHKEGIGWTYKNFDGYNPFLLYTGTQGFCLGGEFRTGTQHGQKNAPAFIRTHLRLLKDRFDITKILVRLDSAFDAAETFLTILDEKADFIISANPRGMDFASWIAEARALPRCAWTRKAGFKNLRVAYLSRLEARAFEGREILVRRVVRMHKRLEREVAEPGGHAPILGKRVVIEADYSWWTTLELPEREIAELYANHATSEQFHSELKGELDLERMPSGKFATNDLVFHLGLLAYNLLRVLGLKAHRALRHRHPTQRRRLRTIIRELILLPARVLHGSKQLKLDLGHHHSAKIAILDLHRELIPPRPKAA